MNATGFLKRSIADQTGFLSYSLDLLLDNTSGECLFGFSGSGNQIDYRLLNGKIYSDDSSYVGNYDKNVAITISGNIGEITNDLYLNGEPAYLGKSKPTGKFSHFYIHPQGVSADFSLYVAGQLPSYKFESTGLFFASNDILTGAFINLNPEVRFRFFSGRIADGNAGFTLSGLTTGDVTGSGQFALIVNQFNYFQNIIPLEFTTNFGVITANFTGSGLYQDTQNFFFLLSFEGTQIQSSTTKEYDLTYRIPANVFINVSLSGASGFYNTGILGTGQATGLVSGLVTGEKYLSGLFSTGIFGSPFGIGATGSGIGSGYISGFQYATGAFSYDWALNGTGFGTGIGYTGEATGIISGTEIFTISGASGTFLFNKMVTGDPLNPAAGGTGVINTGAFFSGWLDYTFSGTGFYTTPATGAITGELIVKDFVWNLFTGVDGDNLINFKTSGFHNHTGYFINTASSGVLTQGLPIEDFKIRVSYFSPSGSGDHLAYLLVSGYNSSGIQLTLTGTT